MASNHSDRLKQEENVTGGHQATDRYNLELARATTACIRADPSKLEVARANLHRLIERGVGGGLRNRYLAHWKRLFDTADARHILEEYEREDEWGDALRQAHPFTGILPPEARERIFDTYASERGALSL